MKLTLNRREEKEGNDRSSKVMRSTTWVAVASIVILGAFSAAISATAGEKEEKTTIDKVPAAVKAAIEKATTGGKVKEIEKEQYDGKVVYDVDYVKDGEKKEINIAEDGTIVTSAKKDDDDKGKDNDNDDDDDDEEDDGK